MRQNIGRRTYARKPIGNVAYNIEWVNRHLHVQGSSGDEYDVCCPVHQERHASMRVNVAKGVCFCHGCGLRGTLPGLARQMGVTYQGNGTQVDMGDLLRKLDALHTQARGSNLRSNWLPESELSRYRFPTAYWTDPIPNGRGLTQATVDAFDLGYDPMNDCVTIPIRDVAGHLLGFTRRFLDPDADRRYKDPKGFDKGSNLFGSWFTSQDPSSYVVLTEGPLDAVKVWQAGHPAVAQFGSHMTAEQLKILRRMGVVTVILFYDNDPPGRKMVRSAHGWTTRSINGSDRAVYDPQHDLRRSFIVKKVDYSGVRAKDPGAMMDSDVNRLVLAAEIVYNRSRT
jgi:DNA primase